VSSVPGRRGIQIPPAYALAERRNNGLLGFTASLYAFRLGHRLWLLPGVGDQMSLIGAPHTDDNDSTYAYSLAPVTGRTLSVKEIVYGKSASGNFWYTINQIVPLFSSTISPQTDLTGKLK